MSTPTTITIDSTEYIRKDTAGPPQPTALRIVIADRGWVFIGQCSENDQGDITIQDAQCIRRWGTDEKRPNLGWLALNGPTEKTVLDEMGTVRVPLRSVVAMLDCDIKAWSL